MDGFKREMAEATRAVDQTAKGTETAAKQADTAMGRMVQSAQKNRAAWDTVGTTLTGFGAAAVGGLALAAKAAMDWESAWAGVQKTVDGSVPQMAALEQGLRSMARELPASHQEIAAVAEAAGQLGIATPNILSFTRTMINMGEATNLSADEAATSLARFVNITGTSQNQIGLLGASIVGLGNNFATTESEILGMSMRLAGAGAQANMSEGDILGIATAMSSVGIEAEAGGSAMSQTMKRIGKAVDEGGSSLELFSQVSGMSAQEFSDAWRNDPTTALDAFITGLSGVESQGMTTNGVLAELGITGIREADSLLRLSAASEQGANGMSLLADAVQTGNAEFDKGTALIEEASKRYETAESRIAMARNALVDSAISIGGVVLPAVAGLADGVVNLAGGFADLPGPVQGTVAALGGLAGVAALGAGSFLLLFPRVMDTVSAFREMGILSDSMAGKLGSATLAVGKAGLAFAALAAVPPILNSVTDAMRGIDDAEFDLGMGELTAGLLEGERTGRMFDAVLGDMYDSGALNKQMFADLGSTVSQVADINWFQKLVGPLAASGINDAKDRLLELSDAFVLLSQTDLSKAQSTFAAFMAEAERSGATFDDVMKVMPSFRDELAGIATQMGLDGTDSAVLYRIAMGELSPVVDETTGAVEGYSEAIEGAGEETETTADAVDELQEKMFSLADGFLNARQAARDYEDALKAANEAIDENGRAWENGTEGARGNAEAIDELSQAALDNAEAMKRNGEDVGGYLEEQRQAIYDVAIEMGATEEQAKAYVDALGLTPEDITTLIELEDQAAREKWNTLWEDLGYHPPLVIDPTVDPEGKVPQFTGLLSDIPPEKNTDVGVETDEAIQKTYGFGDVLEGETQDQTATVHAETEFAMWEVNALSEAIGNAGGTVTINGSTVTAQQALSILQGTINESDGTVTINGRKVPAEEALHTLVGTVNETDGTIDVLADTDTAESAANRAARDRDSTIDVHANDGAAESDLNSTSRDRTSDVTARAHTGGANSDLNSTARNRTSTINANATTWSAENQLNWLARNRTTTVTVRTSGGVRAQLAYATGGPVHGPGTGTSDSIAALLSNGEHVLTAAEVALAGGHDSVFRMRAAIRAGALRFAEGGGVESGGYAAAPPMVAASSGRSQRVSAAVDTGAITNAVAAGAREGIEAANITAMVTDRVAAGLHQRGMSASRAFGGAR